MTDRILAFVLTLALASTGLAQPPTPVALEHDGQSGVWFPTEDARLILQAWRERESLRLLVDNLRLQLDNRRLLVENLNQRVDSYERSITLLERSNRRLSAAAEPQWWESPWLWLTVGLVVGGSIVAIQR